MKKFLYSGDLVQMQNESANINFNEEIGKIFGVDYIEILPKNELKFKVNAVVMHQPQ